MSKTYTDRDLKAAEYAAYVRGAIEWRYAGYGPDCDILAAAHADYPLPDPPKVQRVVKRDGCLFRWNENGYVEWGFDYTATKIEWKSVEDYTVTQFTAYQLQAIADVTITPYEIEE